MTTTYGRMAAAHLSRVFAAPAVDQALRLGIDLHPGQKAIITSGFSESGRIREAQRLGAGAYVKKPYFIDQLGKTIREALAN
jgi:DNA-binding NarL/FixJ family response regulator